MNFYGSFIVFGAERVPEVHLLEETRMRFFEDRCRIAAGLSHGDPDQARATVYREVFGDGAEVAIPCWILEATKMLAERYEGPHRERVRELAKKITCGIPYGPEEKPWPTDKGGNGGSRERVSVRPKPTRPSGGGEAVRQTVAARA